MVGAEKFCFAIAAYLFKFLVDIGDGAFDIRDRHDGVRVKGMFLLFQRAEGLFCLMGKVAKRALVFFLCLDKAVEHLRKLTDLIFRKYLDADIFFPAHIAVTRLGKCGNGPGDAPGDKNCHPHDQHDDEKAQAADKKGKTARNRHEVFFVYFAYVHPLDAQQVYRLSVSHYHPRIRALIANGHIEPLLGRRGKQGVVLLPVVKKC